MQEQGMRIETTRRRTPLTLALMAGAAVALGPGPAAGQAADPLLTATVSQRFEVDTNFGLDDPRPGTSYFADTRLALGLLQETPTQTFALGFNTGLRALWEAEEDFEFTVASPSTATATYGQEWATGAIDSLFRYRQQRVDFRRPLDEFFDPDLGEILTPDDPSQREGDTTERRFDARIGLDLAQDAPSSYSLGLDATRIDYSDPATNRTPRDTIRGDGVWSLRLNPVLSAALAGGYYYYTADNVQDTEIREWEADAGFIYEPSAILRTTLGFGYADREQRERLGPGGTGPREVVESNTGFVTRASVRYDFEEVVVDGNLRISTAAPDTRVSGDIRARYPLPRGQVTGRLFQRFAGGDAGDEIRVSGLGVGLVQDIDRLSRVRFDFAFSRRENQDDPTDPDADRFDFTTSYAYDITETVSASVGYRLRRLDEESLPGNPGDNATSHAVFVEIARAFETRP
jgi:hypothetical protein